jgi:hypothetical protein
MSATYLSPYILLICFICLTALTFVRLGRIIVETTDILESWNREQFVIRLIIQLLIFD